jgi:aminomuconate-semialdehyde/2-hydroxymuconate-6-semialdehyde dehydrogenase
VNKEGVMRLSNFIDNEFVPPESGEYLDNYEPATGAVYGSVPRANAADVELAVTAAKRAFATWKRTTAKERSQVLLRIAELIEKNLEKFALAESRDTGKPVAVARVLDIPRAVDNFRFYAGAILHQETQATQLVGQAMLWSVNQPIGVCALISPWNLPLYLLTWKVAPALAMGNTCVCKPSEFTSVTAWLLCEVAREAGLPRGVLNMVFGLGAECGSALTTHPDVPLVSFTGGTATGERIAASVAPHHKKLSLELGGKNAGIVFADCDFDKAVAGMVAASFSNAGQICLCCSRILVHESVFERFVNAMVEKTAALVPGDPTSEHTRLGALISKEHLAKVASYVALARQEGGTVRCGGAPPENLPERVRGGYFFAPTIITGLSAFCRTNTEEIFGPVVTVIPFKSEEEAISMANCVKYGLACSVWTESQRVAHRVSLEVEAGLVWVNCWMVRDLNVPFGGWKHSGVGREGGRHSLEFYSEQKSVTMAF